MLSRFRNWLLGKSTSRPPRGGGESFGQVTIPHEVARRIFSESPLRSDLRRTIAGHLLFSPREEEELLERPFFRFTLWFLDLPASEANHHSDPFGLLDHSLAVVERALGELAKPNFKISSDPTRNYRERSPLLYAAFVSALLHDAGKATQIDVSAPGKGSWNPILEPLALYRKRHGLPLVGGGTVTFRPGRGMYAHKFRAQTFLPLIFPVTAIERGGAWLSPVLDAFFGDKEASTRLPEPARRVAAIIQLADEESARTDYQSRREEKAKADTRVEAEAPAPPAGPAPSTPPPSAVSTPPAQGDQGLRSAAPSDYLANAVRLGLEQNLLATNVPRAVAFLGAKYLYLLYPQGLSEVAGILKKRWGREDGRVNHLVSLDAPAYAVAQELARHGFLFQESRDRLWKYEATITHPTAEVEVEDVVLLPLSLLHLAKPLSPFGGRISVRSHLTGKALLIGDLDAQGPGPGPEAAAHPPGPVTPPADPDPDALPRKVEIELDPARLLQTLRQAIRSGRLPRNAYRAKVYLREDFAWFVFPDAFKTLAEEDWRVSYSFKLGSRILESLSQLPQVVPQSRRKVLLHARAHPDAAEPKAFVRIATKGFLTRDDLAGLGLWDHEVTPAEDSQPGKGPSGNNGERRPA